MPSAPPPPPAAPPPAAPLSAGTLSAGTLRVRGARTHNLRGVDLDLPTTGLTVMVGPSGSGKTSLLLDTVHAESRRRVALAVGLPAPLRPPVDHLEGLPLTVAVDERSLPAASQPLGHAAELTHGLAILAVALGVLRCPTCARPLPCSSAPDVVAALAALPPGTRLTVLAPVARRRQGGIAPLVEEVARQGFVRVRLDGALHRIEELPPVDARLEHDLDVVVDRVRVEPERGERLAEAVAVAYAAGRGRLRVLVGPEEIEQSWSETPWCPDHPQALRVPSPALLADPRLADADEVRHLEVLPGCSWPALLATRLDALPACLEAAPVPALAAPVRDELLRRIDLLLALGLGHLPLDRRVGELAEGERARLALGRALAVDLRGHLLILDEPIGGLDPDAAAGVVAALRAAIAAGTGVLAVEHRPELVAAADHAVAFGPGAGRAGGLVTWQGPASALDPALLPPAPAVEPRPPPRGGLRLRGATGRNLQGVDLDVPAGALTIVTGPSGSGKTTLLLGTLVPAVARARGGGGGAEEPGGPGDALPCAGVEGAETIEQVVVVDRRAVGVHPSSCVATALGLWTPLRELLARTRQARILGVDAAALRLDRDGGRCPSCQGSGRAVLAGDGPPVDAGPCTSCAGARFQAPAREVRLKGRTPGELLELDLSQATELFSAVPTLSSPLLAAVVVGLGHLPLGMPTASLSGGEAQRIRLARELARTGGVGADGPGRRSGAGRLVVLDAPTVGLHPSDVAAVVEVLRRLADRGASVLVATGDPRLRAAADFELRLGPGAGPAGGRVV